MVCDLAVTGRSTKPNDLQHLVEDCPRCEDDQRRLFGTTPPVPAQACRFLLQGAATSPSPFTPYSRSTLAMTTR